MLQPTNIFAIVMAGAMMAHAQTSGIQWERSFGGAEDDFAGVVAATSDGGFILGGYSYSEPSGAKSGAHFESGDFWIVKLGSDGNKQWDRSFGGSSFDGMAALQETADGGYILAGTSFSGASGNKSSPSRGEGSGDFWIVKLGAGGNYQWDKSFGGTNLDTLHAIQQTGDGGYILGGTSSSGPSGNKTSASFGTATDFWIVKLDASGTRQWDRSFGGEDDDDLRALQQTADGGYILGGTSFSGASGNKTAPNRGQGHADYWVVKLDSGGNKQWDKSFGGDDADELSSAQQTSEGGYILGGHSCSAASGNKGAGTMGSHDYWVVKLDGSGNRLWDHSYGGEDADELHGLVPAGDGGYILGGVSFSALSGNKTSVHFGSDSGDYWLVKIDAQGNKQSEQSIRGSHSGHLLRPQQGGDGSLVLPGLPIALAPGELDFGLAKFGAPLRFMASSLASGRIFQTQLTGITGANYILQGSTNLTHWTPLRTNPAVNGIVSFAHTNVAGTPRQFYRVQQKP